MQGVGLNLLILLLFLAVKRMCSLAPGTTTRTLVGRKHSSEKAPIAMWSMTKPPTQSKNPSAAAFMVDLKHPQASSKKPLSVSEAPSSPSIQDFSPPEIFVDKIRATAEPLPSYNPDHARDLWTSLWAVTLNEEEEQIHITISQKMLSVSISNQKKKHWISQITVMKIDIICKLHYMHCSVRAAAMRLNLQRFVYWWSSINFYFFTPLSIPFVFLTWVNQ